MSLQYLDRSPSLCSNGSTSSTTSSSLPPTPNFDNVPTFTPTASPKPASSDDVFTAMTSTPEPLIVTDRKRGSIGNLATLAREGTVTNRLSSRSSRSPTKPAASTLLMGSTNIFPPASPTTPKKKKEFTGQLSSPTHSLRSNSPIRTAPTSTTSHLYSPSFRSPVLPASPPVNRSSVILSSAIFSSRDPALPPPHSPVRLVRGSSPTREGGINRLSANLTHLELDTDAVPVSGLPNRVRLSRPISSSFNPSPSGVFNSSHSTGPAFAPTSPGKNRPASQYGRGLLPSQTTKGMEDQRQHLVAYEYLCHLTEAREWLAENITTVQKGSGAELLWSENIGGFEESLRNGYALAHLARSLGGDKGGIFSHPVLQFKHTDNIIQFFDFVSSVGLPEIFRFETLDLYNAKNLPKVIFCIHALSHLLARSGVKGIANLVGQIEFTDEEVKATESELGNVRLPNFNGISKAMSRQFDELVVDSPVQPQVQLPPPRSAEEVFSDTAPALQATIRGVLSRIALLNKIRALRASEPSVCALQAHLRGVLARRAFADLTSHVRKSQWVRSKESNASLSRASLAKRQSEGGRKELGFVEPEFIGFQARVRGVLARRRFIQMMQVQQNGPAGGGGRSRIGAGRDADYRKMAMGRSKSSAAGRKKAVSENDQSEVDYREELELEQLQVSIYQVDRENRAALAVATNLDSKIALLIRNKIMSDRAKQPSLPLGSYPTAPLTHISPSDDLLLAPTRPIEPPHQLNKNQELFRQVKRLVRAVLQVQQAKNLEAVLALEVTQEDEEDWRRIVQDEQAREKSSTKHTGGVKALPKINELHFLTFQELKFKTLDTVLQLRQKGIVSRDDKYGIILTTIAQDMQSQERRRAERREDLGLCRNDFDILSERRMELRLVIQSYQEYLQASTAGIQNLKSQFSLPFTRQSQHLKQLKRTNISYQYGSFSYSYSDLCSRGILLSARGVSPRVYSKWGCSISSHEVGVFEFCGTRDGDSGDDDIEGEWKFPVRLEDLLDAQAAGRVSYTISVLLDTDLRLLLALINRKFFS